MRRPRARLLSRSRMILASGIEKSPAKPRLGGVFPTANAAMTLGTEEFGMHHFILGDFFVAELSPCRFDCNRMFLSVKHATNGGGAVAARDTAGAKEKINIEILQRKWPGVFRLNNRRKGVAGTEVTMNWKGYGIVTEEAASKDKKVTGEDTPKKETVSKDKKVRSKKETPIKVQKPHVKKPRDFGKFTSSAVVKYTNKVANSDCLNERCSKLHLKTIFDAIGMQYKGSSGDFKTYKMADLNYDINGGRLEIVQ